VGSPDGRITNGYRAVLLDTEPGGIAFGEEQSLTPQTRIGPYGLYRPALAPLVSRGGVSLVAHGFS
jgi:hypothetical protein